MKSPLFLALAVCSTLVVASGCGGTKPPTAPANTTKGGGAKDPAAAKTAGTKAGTTASASKGQASNSGSSSGGVLCDASMEGVGFCASDTDLVFCSEGSWWVLSCSALDPSAFCGVDVSTEALDCWVPLE